MPVSSRNAQELAAKWAVFGGEELIGGGSVDVDFEDDAFYIDNTLTKLSKFTANPPIQKIKS
jgi:hypothetical protein